MFVAISEYLRPFEEVLETRPAHVAYIDELIARDKLVTAGRQDPPIGGVLLLRADDEAEAGEIVATDPYVINGLARYTLTKFEAKIGPVTD